MDRSVKIYAFFIVLLLALLLVNDSSKPLKISWERTFDTSDKMPFGLYVFDNEIQDFFKKRDFVASKKTPYELFNHQSEVFTEKNTTIVSISGANAFDQVSEKAVLNFVAQGNNLFLSSEQINQKLQKELKFKLQDNYLVETRLKMTLANKKIDTLKYKYFRGTTDIYISEIDKASTTILGTMELNNTSEINFIRIKHGKGYVYIHTQPLIFTNYYLLHKKNYHLAEEVLSYVSTPKVYWINNASEASTLVRYIVSEPALRWAWYIFLLGIAVFLLFNSKRRQRHIPIVKPVVNTTVEFVRTIGNLYFQEKDFQDIIHKNCTYILEKLRHDYFINTHTLDEKFVQHVAVKLQVNPEDVQTFVYLLEKYKKPGRRTENDLIQLNKAIEKLIHDGK